ncbi:hypothetical protein HDV02_006553 [Globomyces sp. JEL0801]|nr:hypothetical protein HDV02_006553 [Globomyces sp. JEL0801]
MLNLSSSSKSKNSVRKSSSGDKKNRQNTTTTTSSYDVSVLRRTIEQIINTQKQTYVNQEEKRDSNTSASLGNDGKPETILLPSPLSPLKFMNPTVLSLFGSLESFETCWTPPNTPLHTPPGSPVHAPRKFAFYVNP